MRGPAAAPQTRDDLSEATMTDTPFQFDRPGERGFGPRTAGEGLAAAAGAEAQEVLADRLRDEVLRNYDPSEELTRHAEVMSAAAGAGGMA